MLFQAIKDAKTDNTDKVKDVLAKIQFNGVSGKITFNAQHNPVKTITIVKVTGGSPQFDSAVQP